MEEEIVAIFECDLSWATEQMGFGRLYEILI